MIDARGYSCPMPVVMVQNEVKKNAPDTLEVLVDSQTCVENVTRFGEKQGYTVSCASEGGGLPPDAQKVKKREESRGTFLSFSIVPSVRAPRAAARGRRP